MNIGRVIKDFLMLAFFGDREKKEREERKEKKMREDEINSLLETYKSLEQNRKQCSLVENRTGQKRSVLVGNNFLYLPNEETQSSIVVFETGGKIKVDCIPFKEVNFATESLSDYGSDSVRFSLANPDKGVDIKQLTIRKKLESMREMVAELREMGASEDMLATILTPKQEVGRLVITRDYEIILPEYENKEVMLRPLPKALYLLFLKHPEGISFKNISDYQQELLDIYNHLTARWQYDLNAKSIEKLVDPTNNSINEKCSRIYRAFIDAFGKPVADELSIKGKRGELKTIGIDRSKVSWE